MFEKDTSINNSFSCLDDGDIDDFCFDFDVVEEPKLKNKNLKLEDISTDEEQIENQMQVDKFDYVHKIV